MLLIFSALAAVVLLLLALRLTQRLTLRFKLLAGMSVSRQPQKSCPHLGASADPFTHEHQPSEDHRCYLWMQRDRIDLVHQKGFCLTTAHHKCPWLMVRHPNATPPLRKRLPRLILALPRTAWGGLRLAPGLVVAAFASAKGRAPSPRPSPAAAGEGGRPFPEGVFAACGLAPSANLSFRERRGAREKLTPSPAVGGEGAHPFRERAFASCGLALRGATARAFAILAAAVRLLGRAAGVGAPRAASALWLAALWSASMVWQLCLLLARGVRWLLPRVGRAVVWSARWVEQAMVSRRQAVAERRVPSPQPSPAAAGEGVMVTEPVATPSLGRLEELLAEGLATLDRGQESLAYHIFVTATEQRAPRGAGGAYDDVIKRAWFWRAKTSETIADVVESLEQALRYEPGNLQMQAHLAWARQRLERERKLMPIELATPPPAPAPLPEPAARWRGSLGTGVRMAGGLMALALAALWMTTAVMPALGRFLSQMPAGDELLLRRLILTLNATALPGQGHLPLPVLNYDLGLALPFVMAFSLVFTARGLIDGDTWARTTGLCLAGIAGWLCAAAVSNPDASRLGLALCVGIIVAVVAGRFDSPKVLPQGWVGY